MPWFFLAVTLGSIFDSVSLWYWLWAFCKSSYIYTIAQIFHAEIRFNGNYNNLLYKVHGSLSNTVDIDSGCHNLLQSVKSEESVLEHSNW